MIFAGGNCTYSTDYDPPRGNVLLLTCMDPRLMDNTVQFMNHDNLVNRYDHVVFAGSSLGALGAPGATDKKGRPIHVRHWRKAFIEHLSAAVALHDVQDLYILEHRNCGAYHKVFHVAPNYDSSKQAQRDEAECHCKYATRLERKVLKWCKKHGHPMRIHKFLMDVRGNVTVLESSGKKKRKPRS